MSDYFNSFANPQGGGGSGSDIPPWLQALINRQMGQGGQPVGPLAANPANLAASPNMANMSVVGLPSSSGFTLPDGTPAPAADASLVRGGVSQGAHAAPPPPQSQPVSALGGKQQQPQQKPPPVKKPTPPAPTAAATDDDLYPFKAIGGANPPAPGTGPTDYPLSTTFSSFGPNTGAAPTGPIDPSIIARQKAAAAAAPVVPGAPSNGAVPNLGYYRPSIGNAQGSPTWVPQGATGAPQMFRGPLALPGSQNYYGQPAGAAPPPPAPAPVAAAPAGAGPGPIAPGVGTQWLRKLFGGGGQPTA